VNFHPAVGYEIQKARPALIIQNDKGNQYSQLTIVAPITSAHIEKIYPTEVFVMSKSSGLGFPSKVLLSQIRTIDKARLGKKIGFLERDEMHEVNAAICESLGIDE